MPRGAEVCRFIGGPMDGWCIAVLGTPLWYTILGSDEQFPIGGRPLQPSICMRHVYRRQSDQDGYYSYSYEPQ